MREVISIDNKTTHEWLEKKHYAHLVPAILLHSFGLFIDNVLVGVCTYGVPPRMYNNGDNLFKRKIEVPVLELSRLCVNEDLPKNSLSFFVSSTFKLFTERPLVLVSYADSNVGHHGYIYQATNWIYTGMTNHRRKFFDANGIEIHERTIFHRYKEVSEKVCLENNIRIEDQEGKHRYFQFLGSKTQRKVLSKEFKLDVLPYPKGDNQRYDSSYKVGVVNPINDYFEF